MERRQGVLRRGARCQVHGVRVQGVGVHSPGVHDVGVHGARVHGVGVHGVPPCVMVGSSTTTVKGARCRGAQRHVHCVVKPCPCDVNLG